MMGDYAEDFNDGSCYSECFTYFDGTHGYPVLCKDCWAEDESTVDAKGVNGNGYQCAYYPPVCVG